MAGLYEVLAITGMFILRLGVPLILTLAVGYWLRRLDRRWEAEAQERRQAIDASLTATHLPQIPTVAQPCWELRSCPSRARESCPAYTRPAVACWIARYQAEGKLPSVCLGCLIFTTARQEAPEPAD